ncbi:SDR family oxidoreductase [Rhodococcus wratislaviensis]|uniref:SDR family oxidoreductase n=1 Tax=Rhodococcus wratislaviensis TaxID=44752 RepID=UPI0036517476
MKGRPSPPSTRFFDSAPATARSASDNRNTATFAVSTESNPDPGVPGNRLESRVAVLTGASGGLGRATARALVAMGFKVALVARDAGRLDALVADLGSESALTVSADISVWTEIDNAMAFVAERWGRIDLVLANAGVAGTTSFVSDRGLHPSEWAGMVRTNVLGTALTARAAMPHLLMSSGQLILIGSVAGTITRPGSMYSVTKWAVAQLAESIRAETTNTDVRVCLLNPGVIDTDLLREDLRSQPSLAPDELARVLTHVIQQPYDVNEITIRPRGAAH